MFKKLVKNGVRTIALLMVFPAACLALFGRLDPAFVFCAQALAVVPGILGSYLRVAYYRLTLEGFGPDGHIALGSYFAHPQASVGARVGIGAYCVLGMVDIGDDTLLASGVQVLSGANQHVRDARGNLTDQGRVFERVRIGPGCWVGAASVIMADLGERVTVAAGSVVAREVPAGVTVAGNPSRPVRPPIVASATAGAQLDCLDRSVVLAGERQNG
jgi:virginiamycin A acetyltransferase